MHSTLDEVVRAALTEGRAVTIEDGNGGFHLAVDGTPITGSLDDTGIAWESFGYPIGDIPLEDEQQALVDELLERRAERVAQRRRTRLRTRLADHLAAEGVEIV